MNFQRKKRSSNNKDYDEVSKWIISPNRIKDKLIQKLDTDLEPTISSNDLGEIKVSYSNQGKTLSFDIDRNGEIYAYLPIAENGELIDFEFDMNNLAHLATVNWELHTMVDTQQRINR